MSLHCKCVFLVEYALADSVCLYPAFVRHLFRLFYHNMETDIYQSLLIFSYIYIFLYPFLNTPYCTDDRLNRITLLSYPYEYSTQTAC